MTSCCDKYGDCRQGRDCPVRIERVRQAKARLDDAEPDIPMLLIGRLALAAAILLVIFVGSVYRDTLVTIA
jgi:hypothetical protein